MAAMHRRGSPRRGVGDVLFGNGRKDLAMKMQDAIVLWALSVLALGLGGCAGRTSLFPNSDTNLRKTSAEFAADAAKR